MKSKIILLLAVFMATNAFALKITNYTQSSNGAFHHVTAAFDDLGQSGEVRCVITMNDSPVGMTEDTIKGVGTLTISIMGGTPAVTNAECLEIE
jgi:hypothetical protein